MTDQIVTDHASISSMAADACTDQRRGGNRGVELFFARFGDVCDKNARVSLIVRDLDDETMLKMMAADNDDVYNLSPAFILETVAAARSFTEKRDVRNVTDRRGIAPIIASFLAWPEVRVEHALAQLNAIEEGDLSKKAVESLPTIHAAGVLRRQKTTLGASPESARQSGGKLFSPGRVPNSKFSSLFLFAQSGERWTYDSGPSSTPTVHVCRIAEYRFSCTAPFKHEAREIA